MPSSYLIAPEIIERILAAAKIEDVIGEYVNLKRRGANLIGLCPFHTEKTGSFTVSPAKRIFKCFGCGKAGDVVRFVMEKEGMSYPEALRFLAKKYHIEVPERPMTDDEKQRQSDRESMFIVNDFANQWFQEQLWNSDEGRAIGQSYLRERGIREDIARRFQLGYAPERGQLWQVCERQGYVPQYLTNDPNTTPIIGTGLCLSDQDGKLYDRFRGRIMFPFFSTANKVTGFSGRLLKTSDKAGKYVNSPTSLIYEKHNELYGLSQALPSIRQKQLCYLVEGQIDVLQMVQSGIENVVASGGTSLTVQQIKLIHRHTENITILYDGDYAGIKAAIRGIDMVIEEGINVRVVLLPDGEDPDSFARKHNADELNTYIQDKAVDFIRFKIGLLSEEAMDDPVKQAEMILSIAESVSKVRDVVKREVYIKDSADKLAIGESVFRQKVNEILGKKPAVTAPQVSELKVGEPGKEADRMTPSNAVEKSLYHLLRIIVRYGENILYRDENGCDIKAGEYICQSLADDQVEIHNPTYQLLIDEYKQHRNETNFVPSIFFSHHEDSKLSQLAVDLILDKYQLSRMYSKKSISENVQVASKEPSEEDTLPDEVSRLLFELKYAIVEERISTMRDMLKQAQADHNEALIRDILELQPQLLAYRQQLCQALGGRVIIR